MSRTTLCVLTAALLAAGSVGLMIARYAVLGDEIKSPRGPGTWKVALVVQGTSQDDARLQTITPPSAGRQQISHERFRSRELLEKIADGRGPHRHTVVWSQKPGVPSGPFRARYEFFCTVDPTYSGNVKHKGAPQPGEYLEIEGCTGAEAERVADVARDIVEGCDQPADQVAALFHYVSKEIGNEPGISGPGGAAVDCLREQSGDAAAKSRLFVALLRHRGIPARIITGLALGKGHEQLAHHWVEAWLHNRWLPLCTFYHYFGKVPYTYLVFGIGDIPIVRGRHVRDLDYAFLVQRTTPDDLAAERGDSTLHRVLASFSLFRLPSAERGFVELLLLLPVAALMICVFRNVIGVVCFGTFAPALVGLAFRDPHSLPGMIVFVSIILVGWLMRRVLDYFHLLQVPRTALLLSLVVVVLIGGVVVANYQEVPATKYVSLFPMVILTGMIERFWTLETEDSTASSFKTLLGTIFVAGIIALTLSLHAVVNQFMRYPETLGIVMAVQLLIGRYTGYRVSELFRFRDFLRKRPTTYAYADA